MHPTEPVPESIVRRAAAIARGPHPCPNCEAPTWAEPPVPWIGLRDYVVRCDACDRPIAVRVERDLVLRRDFVPRAAQQDPGMFEPVVELLDTRGRRPFVRRVLVALPLPVLAALVVLVLGGTVPRALAAFSVAALPAALWGPALFGIGWSAVRDARTNVAQRWLRRRPRRTTAIEVGAGRWDQWMREERRREREREEHPGAVLRELERVLDDRELHRVRALAERGEVPSAHLDDLLRFRRSWSATVA